MFGPYNGALDNGGETVTLKAGAGAAVVFSLTYSDQSPWPAGADGLGRSLVPGENGPTDPADPLHWRASSSLGGSPGAADPAPAAFGFGAVAWNAGLLQVTFNAEAGQTYSLEGSTNLVNWTPILTHTGPWVYTAPSVPGQTRLFLRAIRP